jgi:hypothetical protein
MKEKKDKNKNAFRNKKSQHSLQTRQATLVDQFIVECSLVSRI